MYSDKKGFFWLQTPGAKIKVKSKFLHPKFMKGKRIPEVFSKNSDFLLSFLNGIASSILSIMPAFYLTHWGADIYTTDLCKETPTQWRVVLFVTAQRPRAGTLGPRYAFKSWCWAAPC